jgi:hypothetical protein
MNRRAAMVVPDVAVTAVADSGFVRAQPCRDLLAGTIFVSPRPKTQRTDPATRRSILSALAIGWGADELH